MLQLLARPPPHDSHTQTRAWARAHAHTRTQGDRSSMSTLLQTYNPAGVGAPRPSPCTHLWGRVGGWVFGGRGPWCEEGAGDRSGRDRSARARAPSLNQCPLLYPLAVPGPHLGTPLQRTSPKLGLSLASSPVAPGLLRPRRVSSIPGKMRANESTAKKEAVGRWEGTRSCGTECPRGSR